MSWYVEVAAKSKESIAKRLETEQYIPSLLKDAMLAQVKGLPEATAPGYLITLKTSGHLDPNGGNAEFVLRQIPIVE